MTLICLSRREAGVQAELHVWAGGFHGYDTVAPDTAITRATVQARESWIDRVLGGAGGPTAR